MRPLPIVSVVMPLFNKRPYVRRAIESIQKQTMPNWELIIVDDGSTDNPFDEIPLQDLRLQLLRQENRGPGAARNAGIARARGRYMAFLDADDEWLPSFLEAGLRLLEDRTADVRVAYTGFYYYPSMRRHAVGTGEGFRGVIEISPDTDLGLVHQLCCYWTCAALISTDAVRKWGGFFDRYRCLLGEDVFLFIKLAFNERIGVIPEPHVIYHTEASDLYGGGTIGGCSRIPPYLEDPAELLAACPPEKVFLLKKLLAGKALRKAETLAKGGNGRQAKELLNRFTRSGYPSAGEVFKVRLFAGIAPVLPTIGWLWRNAKIMTGAGGPR